MVPVVLDQLDVAVAGVAGTALGVGTDAAPAAGAGAIAGAGVVVGADATAGDGFGLETTARSAPRPASDNPASRYASARSAVADWRSLSLNPFLSHNALVRSEMARPGLLSALYDKPRT